MRMKVRAYGKLNLSLAINGKRGNMHLLDSIATTVSAYDELEVEESENISVSFDCEGISPTQNTAYKTALLVRELCGKSLTVSVKKRLPIGGGMGGSSADAVGVLYASEKLFGINAREIAPKIGSDVLFMLGGGTAIISGVGDQVTPIKNNANFSALIVDCGVVSTADYYKIYDSFGGVNARPSTLLANKLALGALPDDLLENDLLHGALTLNPRIKEVMDILSAHAKPHLTGSGGCVFALNCKDKALIALLKSKGFDCYEVNYHPVGVEEI